MDTTGSRSVAPSTSAGSMRHLGALYEGMDGFIDEAVPFLSEGARRGERMLVAVDQQKIQALRTVAELDGAEIAYVDIREAGRNPARIIPLWRRFVSEFGEGGRGIGEPVWPDRSPSSLTEALQHEALLNVAFQEGPSWDLLCPYDRSRLSGEVLQACWDTHPVVRVGGVASSSGTFDASRMAIAYRDPLPPRPDTDIVVFERPDAALRTAVRSRPQVHGLPRERVEDLVLAIDEVAGNSVRHGGAGGTVAVWRDGECLVAEIRGAGVILDPLVGRNVPSPDLVGGLGLWIVNQLCDLVQIRPDGRGGTIVRLHLSL